MIDSQPSSQPSSSSSLLTSLQTAYEGVKERFHLTHTHASGWLKKRGMDVQQLRTNSQQLMAAATLATQVATAQPINLQIAQSLSQTQGKHKELVSQITLSEHDSIMEKMKQAVLLPPGHLEKEDELYLEQQLSDMLGFEVTAELQNRRLNHTIGIMGGEQHLKRFPTDTLDQHDAYLSSGIAPNRGAFGWFTEGGELTDQAIAREKYYFAVQTLYLPDWNTNHKELKPFYKFRKMVAVNPAEGMAVVGVVGDAGPALWVNKQFGGSPEVIREGKIWTKASRGRVILYFVDDPEDKVPLGPIDLNGIKQQLAQAESIAQPTTLPRYYDR